jgi:cyclic-di-AMP phosphodiesterase PgpH
MLGFFERQRLVKKGLAPHKTRRRVTESELLETLEHGSVAKICLIGLFAVGLAWLLMWGGEALPVETLLVAFLIYGTATAHLCLNRREVWSRNSRILLLFIILFSHLAMVKFCLLMAAEAVVQVGDLSNGQLSGFDKRDLWRLAIPFAFGPMMVSVLLGRGAGVFAAVFLTLLGLPVFASISEDLVFIITNTTTGLVCGFVAIFLTMEVRKRGDLPRAGLFVGLTTWVLAIAFKKIKLLHIWDAAGVLNWNLGCSGCAQLECVGNAERGRRGRATHYGADHCGRSAIHRDGFRDHDSRPVAGAG